MMAALLRQFILREELNAKALYAFLKMNWRAMADAGHPLSVVIQEAKSKRTNDQNKLLHAILTEIAENAYVNGRKYSVEAWKEFYRQKFIGTEEVELPSGERQERGVSTTTLSVQEFTEFVNKIQVHAVTELGIELSL